MQGTLLSLGINCAYIHGVEDMEIFVDLYRSVFIILNYDDGPISKCIINGAQFYSDIMRFEISFTHNHCSEFKPWYII